MNLAPLQTFLTILETGSLVRAAERLNVTQSTVTARLKTLEDDLGQPLIQRLKSGAVPTASGLRLRRYAETILGLWGQARQEARLPDTVGTICNFAVDPDLWPGLGQSVMRCVLDADPGAAFSLLQGTDEQLAAWLAAGRADLVLTASPPRQAGYRVFDLPGDELILVSSLPDVPLRFDPGYVYVDAGEGFGRQHAVHYADAGTARISFGAAGPALDFLLDRGGTAYLPRRLARSALASGILFEITAAPVFQRPLYLVADEGPAIRWVWLQDLVASLTGKAG